jgi:ketosteroid isomerase-like protein
VVDDNVVLLQQMMAATGTNDWAAVESLLCDDFVIVEPPGLPYGGSHRGAAGFRHMVELFQQTWADLDIEVVMLAGVSDVVILKVRLKAVAAATGRRVDASVAEFFTIRDGRIAASEVFYADLAEVLAALSSQ